mgnify:CR=1 FL=1
MIKSVPKAAPQSGASPTIAFPCPNVHMDVRLSARYSSCSGDWLMRIRRGLFESFFLIRSMRFLSASGLGMIPSILSRSRQVNKWSSHCADNLSLRGDWEKASNLFFTAGILSVLKFASRARWKPWISGAPFGGKLATDSGIAFLELSIRRSVRFSMSKRLTGIFADSWRILW